MVLDVAGILGEEDIGTALAFLLRSDVTDDLTYAHRIPYFIKPPNGDAFFALFHTR